MTSAYDLRHQYLITGTGKNGLIPTRFPPHNSLQGATYPFADTVVEIASHPQNFNVRALSGPAIELGCRSYDLDDASGLTDEICLF